VHAYLHRRKATCPMRLLVPGAQADVEACVGRRWEVIVAALLTGRASRTWALAVPVRLNAECNTRALLPSTFAPGNDSRTS